MRKLKIEVDQISMVGREKQEKSLYETTKKHFFFKTLRDFNCFKNRNRRKSFLRWQKSKAKARDVNM